MEQIIEVKAGDSLPLSMDGQKIPLLDREVLKRHAPSAHFCLLRDNQLFGRCSIWTDATPTYRGRSVGVVGHYAAADRSAGASVLNYATQRLRGHGFHTAVGPMDGNTWRRYRLLTRRGSEPIFFLEPDNPDDWPEHFSAAGFTPLATYFSAMNDDLSCTDPRIPAVLIRLNEEGVRIRQIEPSRFEDELKAVHELSIGAFAGNFLYTPISEAEFLAMYAPLRPHIRPELVLLAEKESQLVGFIFGLPDLSQSQRGEPITTAIAKSLAVRPGRAGAAWGAF